MFDSLSTQVDEMNSDTAAELVNFNENLQANIRRLDDLFIMLQQIQQTLPPAGAVASSGVDLCFYKSGIA